MELIISLNGTLRESFEKHLQSWNWQFWGQFKVATNNPNVIIAQKQEWKFDVKVCYAGSKNYDYFVLFTPFKGHEELFDKEPYLLESLAKDFVNFINVDYHRDVCDSVMCKLIR